MADDVRSMFEDVTTRLAVPAGDLGAVVRGGRRRRHYKLAAGVTVAAALVATAWGVSAELRATIEADSRLAAPQAPENPAYVLVPDELEGRPPSKELAEPDDVATARAVTVAFHGLLFRLSHYDFDYQGVVRTGRSWDVTFLDGTPEETLEGAVESRRDRIEEMEALLAERQRELASLEEQMRDEANEVAEAAAEAGGKARALAEQAETIARKVASIAAVRAHLAKDLDDLAAALREQRRAGGPFPVALRVVESGNALVVERVETDSPRERELEAVVGYGERVEAVDVWGVDYYGGRLVGPGVADDVKAFEMHAFWTGPIPSDYEETCRPTLVDEAGETVWRQRATGYHRYESAPETEDRRDGWVVSFGVDYDGPLDEVELLLRCRWRERR